MLASPCGGAYGSTGFCKLFFEVVSIFGVGMTLEVIHIFSIMMTRMDLAMAAAEDPWAILYCLRLLAINYH